MDEVDGTRKFSDLRIRILNWETLVVEAISA